MKTTNPPVPVIGLVAITRAMLGAGITLLNSGKLSGEQRRAVGWTLTGVGLVTTIPLLFAVFKCERECGRDATD